MSRDYHINRSSFGLNRGDSMLDTRHPPSRIRARNAEEHLAMKEVDDEIANRKLPGPPALIDTELDPVKLALSTYSYHNKDFHQQPDEERPLTQIQLERLRKNLSARRIARKRNKR